MPFDAQSSTLRLMSMKLTAYLDDESEEESSDESVDVPTQPVAARRKFDDEEDSDDVSHIHGTSSAFTNTS